MHLWKQIYDATSFDFIPDSFVCALVLCGNFVWRCFEILDEKSTIIAAKQWISLCNTGFIPKGSIYELVLNQYGTATNEIIETFLVDMLWSCVYFHNSGIWEDEELECIANHYEKFASIINTVSSKISRFYWTVQIVEADIFKSDIGAVFDELYHEEFYNELNQQHKTTIIGTVFPGFIKNNHVIKEKIVTGADYAKGF